MTQYNPQVNDFVVWTKGVEGWVYFRCDEYITIEHNVRPKDEVNLECCPIHKNNRLLVLCYKDQCKELEYIKSRARIHEEEEKLVSTCC